jgi:hypothetical protein
MYCSKSTCYYHGYTNHKLVEFDFPKEDLREAESIRIDKLGNMLTESIDPSDGYNFRFKVGNDINCNEL